jgi:hypothetical protein
MLINEQKINQLLDANNGIKNPEIRKLTKVMIENQLTHGTKLNEAGTSFFAGSFGGQPEDTSTFDTDALGWAGISASLVRSVWPNILAPYIVASIPMSQSTAKVFYKKAVADQSYGDYAAGRELGITINKDYTGSYAVSASEKLGQVGYGTFKSASLVLESKTVAADWRKLKTEWSIEAQAELMAAHNLSIRAEMIEDLANELASEISEELISEIKSVATSGNWDYNSSTDTGGGRWEMEKYAALYHKLIRECNAVGVSARMGQRGNWCVASPTVCAVFEALSNFIPAPLEHDLNTGNSPGTPLIGAVGGGSIRIYMNTLMDDDTMIIGFKGSNLKSGLTWCPFVPFQVHSAVDSNFNPSIGLATAYGLLKHPNISSFYRQVKCLNLPQ